MSAMVTTSSNNPSAGPSSSRQYVFTQEIARMAYVHCQLTDPDESTLRHIEDLLRTQLVEVVLQARAQAARRGSRQLAVEDLLFLIRHDKAKLNRIRAYLSSRSAHQKYSESGEADDDRELDSWGFQIDHSGTDEVLHVGEVEVRLPWELDGQFDTGADDEGEDEDEQGVVHENRERLKALDLITRGMTKEEYIRYTESRQATFVGRKSSAHPPAKKFRDFLSMSHLLDGPPTDDVLDVFAFLAYELVGTLCAAGLEHRRNSATARAKAAARDHRIATKRKAQAEAANPPAEASGANASPAKAGAKAAGKSPAKANASPSKKSRTREPSAAEEGSAKSPPSRSRTLVPPTSLFSEPLSSEPKGGSAAGGGGTSPGGAGGVKERPTLQLEDLHSGFFELHQGRSGLKMGGMRNWRAGVNRRRGLGPPLV